MPAKDEEDVDPATGLMVKEKAAIVQSWQYVLPNQKVESVAFFEKLFTTYPEYIDYFPKFKGKQLAELKEMSSFVLHAKSVFTALTAVVNNLDNADYLVKLLLKTGKDHKMRGVPKQPFHNLALVFIDFMEERLGSNFTPLAKSSWQKALVVVVDVCHRGMNEE
ncbi:globin-like [Octopus bimaculoides]|uniref:globin-like n=1 Tax=Octopus bimaculoides TaxID=37653 RepID=UPI00071C6E32|nr:globin-like [Octopus bimaculoides]|eukprot:XP_014777175.1 PREDICTED: globin-like [Octopus bimaculoides]